MEQRKLIRLGNSSFAVALPKEWINRSGLKKGDEVFITPNSDGEIIVSHQQKKNLSDKKTVINIDGKDDKNIRREFTSDYINGCSIFEFTGAIDREKGKIIKNIINHYISCEVSEESSTKVVVKDFFNLEELNLNNFMRRIDNNIEEMFDIIIQGISGKKISREDMEEMNKIDLDVNKFYFLTSRILTLGLNNPSLVHTLKIKPTELFNNWWLAFHLEHIGDDLKIMANKIKSEKLTAENREIMASAFREMKERHGESLRIFYTQDNKKAYELMESGKKMCNLAENLMKSKSALLIFTGARLKEMSNASYQILKMMSHMNMQR